MSLVHRAFTIASKNRSREVTSKEHTITIVYFSDRTGNPRRKQKDPINDMIARINLFDHTRIIREIFTHVRIRSIVVGNEFFVYRALSLDTQTGDPRNVILVFPFTHESDTFRRT